MNLKDIILSSRSHSQMITHGMLACVSNVQNKYIGEDKMKISFYQSSPKCGARKNAVQILLNINLFSVL